MLERLMRVYGNAGMKPMASKRLREDNVDNCANGMRMRM
jgi:hypothetical protein